MRWKTEGGHDWMLEMQEKRSFTNDKTREYGAAGAYWFRTGALMKTYFTLALERGMRTGSELFCSMPYNLLVHDGLRVLIAQMPWFCQWGTPQDLEEYEAWSRAFAVLAGKPKGKTDIPVGREPNVRARRASPKDTRATFAYWHEFFSLAPWHPYGKAAHG
jgi:hypothetical protein